MALRDGSDVEGIFLYKNNESIYDVGQELARLHGGSIFFTVETCKAFAPDCSKK